MKLTSSRTLVLMIGLALAMSVFLSGCEYDPPPLIVSSIPEFSESADSKADIVLNFSEALNISSLEVAIWYSVDGITDIEGQLQPQCKDGKNDGNCARMWFGPFKFDKAQLFLSETPCTCLATQDYRGSKMVLEQDCRTFQSYENHTCRSYMLGENEICRDFVEGEGGDCLETASLYDNYTVREIPIEEIPTRLTIDPASALDIGQYMLRISPGLSDLAGNSTGETLDLLFAVSGGGEEGETDFSSGIFISWLDLSQPLAYPLEVYWNIDVDSTTGSFVGSGCDADTVDTSIDHTNHIASNWFPWPFVYDEGYNFPISGQIANVEVEEQEGYSLTTVPFRIYAGPPIEVEVLDGTIEVNIFYNEDLGREEMTGLILSPETYILGSKESGSRPDVARGVIYGYRLGDAEVEDLAATYPDEWNVFLNPDEDARPAN